MGDRAPSVADPEAFSADSDPQILFSESDTDPKANI
jgi:hypothetical protein